MDADLVTGSQDRSSAYAKSLRSIPSWQTFPLVTSTRTDMRHERTKHERGGHGRTVGEPHLPTAQLSNQLECQKERQNIEFRGSRLPTEWF